MKLFKSFFLGCLSAIAVTNPASAEPISIPLPQGQWQSLFNIGNGVDISLNPGSLARQGNIVAFWLKLEVANSNTTGMYFAANCSTGASKPLWKVITNQGRLLQSTSLNQPVGILRPGSLDWQILNVACGGQAQSEQADIVKAQLDALTRNSASSAESISNAMNAGARLFK